MKNLKAMVWCGLFAAMVLASSASAVPDFVKDHFGAGSGEKNDGYFVGEVKIAEPAGQYVYLQVQEFDGKKKVWVATQRFQARAGMKVRFRLTDPSKNFKSPTTGKVFEEIYLIPAIDVAKADTASEDCFLVKGLKDGDKVALQGIVTKVNVGILGTNWVHIQDEEGRCLDLDLTLTTAAEPKVGDVVKAQGTLRLNHTVAEAMHFPVLIENATLKN